MGRRGTQQKPLAGGLATALTATASVAVALLACGRPAEVRYREELAETPAPADHAVHEARLVELMRGLDGLRGERLPQAIDPAAAEARRAREVARVALAMAKSARRIADAAPPGLGPDERAEFVALADLLAQRCEALASDAESLDRDARRDRLSEIDAVCHQCHDRFRIPGPAEARDLGDPVEPRQGDGPEPRGAGDR